MVNGEIVKPTQEIKPISPLESRIAGVGVTERKIFADQRGFLIETFVRAKEESASVYSYNSLTRPGEARDVDRFHFHREQKDRFTVVLGRMWVLLYDARENSPTYGSLEIVELVGGDPAVCEKMTLPAFTLTVPEGVYHGIMNPGSGPAMIVNHPTTEYNPGDEGRIPFSDVDIPQIGRFSWDLVFGK